MSESKNTSDFYVGFVFPVWKRKWFVLGFALLVIVTTFIMTKRQKKVYQASVQIVIDLHAPQYLARTGTEVMSLGMNGGWNTREFLETQFRIIRSRLVGEIVVRRLKLHQDEEFLGVLKIKDAEKRSRALKNADAISILLSRVIVEPSSDSRVVRIKVTDYRPARARLIANAMAEAYADQNVNRKVSAALDAVKWLDEQTTTLRRDVTDAENAVLDFKRHHNILNSSLETQQQLVSVDLQDARKRLRDNIDEKEAMESKLSAVKGVTIEEVSSGVEEIYANGLIQRMKERIVKLEADRTDLLKKYLPKHPDIQTIDQNIKRTQELLGKEVEAVRNTLQRKYRVLAGQNTALKSDVARLEELARQTQAHELTYRRLNGVVEAKKSLYNQMLTRHKEAELQAQTRANNVRVLDEALLPKVPIRPRPFFNLLAAIFVGFVGGIGFALLIDRLDNSVKSQADLEHAGLHFLGLVPAMNEMRRKGTKHDLIENPDRCVIDFPTSAAAECVRTIRTNLLFMSPDNKLRTMMVTSAGPREGKTCTCINIAATMALSGSRTLVIDSDLRRPRMHKVFGMRNVKGLTNLVMDAELPVSSMVQTTEVPNLDILCAGPLPPNPSELLHTRGFSNTLSRALEEYDRIILDSPPVGAVTDAQVLGQQVDGCVLVVSAMQTRRFMMAKAIKLLRDVNVNLLGGLLNNLSVGTEGYGQYYYTYYRQSEAEGGSSS